MRRFATQSSAPLTAGARHMAAFSEQNSILEQQAKHLGYSSNLWIENWALGKLGVTLKPGEKTTTVTVPKVIEMYNLSQLQMTSGVPATSMAMNPAVPTSRTTTKPFSKQMAKEMDKVAAERQFTSNWWLTKYKVKDQQMQTTSSSGPAQKFYITGTEVLVNADQLVDATPVHYSPISHSLRRFYGNETDSKLLSHNKKLDAKVGLVLSDKAITDYNLRLKIGATGIAISFSPTGSLFSLDQIENSDTIMQELNRLVAPAVPTYLLSGRPVTFRNPDMIARAGAQKNKYFISSGDLTMHPTWKLAAGAKPFSVFEGNLTTMYSVQELENPADGFRIVSTAPGSKAAASS